MFFLDAYYFLLVTTDKQLGLAQKSLPGVLHNFLFLNFLENIQISLQLLGLLIKSNLRHLLYFAFQIKYSWRIVDSYNRSRPLLNLCPKLVKFLLLTLLQLHFEQSDLVF